MYYIINYLVIYKRNRHIYLDSASEHLWQMISRLLQTLSMRTALTVDKSCTFNEALCKGVIILQKW